MVSMHRNILLQLFRCLLAQSLDFNVDQDKDPVGDGEGGVDDGDEEEADVLDLLLRLALPPCSPSTPSPSTMCCWKWCF